MAGFSFRAKIVVAFAASVLAGVFLLFLLGNMYVNVLQRRNVEEAVTLAREQARQLRDELLAVWGDMPHASISDPYIRDRMRQKTEVVLKRNKNVEWVAVIDHATGAVVVQGASEGDAVLKPLMPGEKPYTSAVESTGGDTLEVSVREQTSGREINESIRREGKPVGEIRLRVRDTPTFERIEATSRQITTALLIESILLLLFLLLIFWILYRLFVRQVQLVKKNAALDQMAYVGTLASGLAHEIRNPLSAMNVNLEVMREELAEKDPEAEKRVADLASRVQKEVQQLNSTLTSFLEFALPGRETFSRFSLFGLLDELLKAHMEQMRQAGIQVELTGVPPAEAMVNADHRLVHQAFRNVLLNAIQAVTPSLKKQIRVHVRKSGENRVCVTFADTGPGIPSQNLDKVFDVFFSTRKGGSGFGLAIARKVIEAHSGTIRAENNPEGMGALFTIELPQETQQ